MVEAVLTSSEVKPAQASEPKSVKKESPIARSLRGLDNFGAAISRGFVRFYVKVSRRDKIEAELVNASVSGFFVGIAAAFLFTPAFFVSLLLLCPLSLAWAWNATVRGVFG